MKYNLIQDFQEKAGSIIDEIFNEDEIIREAFDLALPFSVAITLIANIGSYVTAFVICFLLAIIWVSSGEEKSVEDREEVELSQISQD